MAEITAPAGPAPSNGQAQNVAKVAPLLLRPPNPLAAAVAAAAANDALQQQAAFGSHQSIQSTIAEPVPCRWVPLERPVSD